MSTPAADTPLGWKYLRRSAEGALQKLCQPLRQPIRLSIKRLINKNASAFAAVIHDLSPGLGCSTNSDRVYLSEPADWLATGRMGVEADEEEVAHRDEPITRRIERGATAPQNAPNTTHGFRSMDATEMINATGHL